MDSTLARVIVAVAAGALVTALVVAAWLVVQRAREERDDHASSDSAGSERPSGELGTAGQERQDTDTWRDAPEATYGLQWHVGESGAQGYVIVHQSDGRQVPKKQLPRESGGVVSELIGVDRFQDALQSDSVEPGRSLLLRRLEKTGEHPASVGVWDRETNRQVGYLSPDVSDWAERVFQGGEALFCLSLWEHWRTGERTRLKVLLLRKTASFTLPDKLSPEPSFLNQV